MEDQMPRYCRINTLVTTNKNAIKQLRAEGYEYIKDKTSGGITRNSMMCAIGGSNQGFREEKKIHFLSQIFSLPHYLPLLTSSSLFCTFFLCSPCHCHTISRSHYVTNYLIFLCLNIALSAKAIGGPVLMRK